MRYNWLFPLVTIRASIRGTCFTITDSAMTKCGSIISIESPLQAQATIIRQRPRLQPGAAVGISATHTGLFMPFPMFTPGS